MDKKCGSCCVGSHDHCTRYYISNHGCECKNDSHIPKRWVATFDGKSAQERMDENARKLACVCIGGRSRYCLAH